MFKVHGKYLEEDTSYSEQTESIIFQVTYTLLACFLVPYLWHFLEAYFQRVHYV